MEYATFTIVKKGYDPMAVDAEIRRLKLQIAEQDKAIESYCEKVQHLSEATKRIEEERLNESRRMTSVLAQVSKLSEQIEAEARIKAEDILADAKKFEQEARHEAENIISETKKVSVQIREKAYSDCMETYAQLGKMKEQIKRIRDANNEYITLAEARLDDVDKIIQKTVDNAVSIDFTPEPLAIEASVHEDTPVLEVIENKDATKKAAAKSEEETENKE